MLALVLVVSIAIAVSGFVMWRPDVDEPAPVAAPPAPPLPQPDLSGAELLVREKVDAMRRAARDHPASPAAWGRLAMTLDAHGFAAEAVPCYERAAALDPSNPKWPYLLAIVMSTHAIGDPIPWLARAASLAPSYAPIHLRHAEALLYAGRTDEAVAAANNALAAAPDHPHAHFVLGRAALARNDLEAAKRHVEFLTRREPVLQGAHTLAADLYRRLGDAAAAARHDEAFRRTTYTAHVDDPVWGEMQAEKTGTAVMTRRGTEHLAAGNAPAAEHAFRAAMRSGPAADAHSGLAAALLRQRRLPEARDAARRALELDPAELRAYEQLAMAHAGLGEFRDAADALRRGLEMTSREPGLTRLLAGLLATAPDAAVRDGPEAVRLTEEVMARRGASAQTDPRLLDQLAMAYAAAGRFDDAAATVRRALGAANQSGTDTGRHERDMQRRLALYLAHQPYIETRW